MAGAGRRDVELLIRAKNEASRGIDAVGRSLEDLFAIQHRVAGGATDTASALGAIADVATVLNRAFGQIAARTGQAEAAFAAQQRAVAETRRELATVNGFIASTSRAIVDLSLRLKEASAQGLDTSLLRAGLEQAQADYRALTAEAGALGRSLEVQEASVARSENSLLQMRDATQAAAAAQTFANAELEETTRSIKAQGAAAAQAAAVLERVNRVTGVERTAPGKSAEESAGVFEADFAEQERRAAIEAERLATAAAKLRAELDPVGAVAARTAARIAELRQLLDAKAITQAEFDLGVDKVEAEAKKATAALDGTAAAADKAAKQTQEMSAAAAKLIAELDPVAAAFARANATLDDYDAMLKAGLLSKEQHAQASDRIAAALRKEVAALDGSADAEAKTAAEAQDLERSYQRLIQRIDPLAAAHDRFNVEMAEVNRLFKAGVLNADQYRKAQQALQAELDESITKVNATGKGDSQKVALFGLKPYELTNLGYQINDVFTQLASGTSVLQTLAQQGGQILQLMPKLGSAIIANLGKFAGLGVILLAVFIPLRKALSDMAKERAFAAMLNSSADGAAATAKELKAAADTMERFGVEAEDATKILRRLVDQGFNPAAFERFARAAKDMADRLGTDTADAAQQLTAALAGGYDALVAYDEQVNIFTADERKRIRTLAESGKAEQARAEAFRIITQRAAAMRGAMSPLDKLTRSLSTTWAEFLKVLANSHIIQNIAEGLGVMANGVNRVLQRINGSQSTSAEVAAEIEVVTKRLETLRAAQEKLGKSGGYDFADDIKAAERELARLQSRQREISREAVDPVNEESQARKKARDEAIHALNLQAKALEDLSDAQKVELEGEIAYREALGEKLDEEVAKRRRLLAVEREIARQRQSIDFASFAKKVAGIESNGDNNARPIDPKTGRARSTALGQGQFLEKTWLTLFRKHFPDKAAELGEAAILDLRRDQKAALDMIQLLAKENQAFLREATVQVNETSLYLAHFLGAEGAEKVIKAASRNVNTPTSAVLSQKAINANPEVLRGKTVGDVVGFAQKKVGASDTQRDMLNAAAQVADEIKKKTRETAEAQVALDAAIDDSNSKRLEAAQVADRTAVLTGEALIDEQKRVHIEEALAEAVRQQTEENRAAHKEVREAARLSDERVAAVEAAAAAEFDAAHATERLLARREAAERAVNGLVERRALLLEQIDAAQRSGDASGAALLLAELRGVNAELDQGVDAAIAFWISVAGSDEAMGRLNLTKTEIANIVAQLRLVKTETDAWRTQFIASAEQINEQMASGLATAFDDFINRIVQGKNVLESLALTFGQFAIQFLRDIGLMILKQAIFNAISGEGGKGGLGGQMNAAMAKMFVAAPVLAGAASMLSAANNLGIQFATQLQIAATTLLIANSMSAGGGGGGTSGFAGLGGFFHSGGIAGSANRSRRVPAAWYQNAVRYHSGGIAGLKPNEVPAVLERGEEILTREDPRHRNNVGSGGGSGPSEIAIRSVLVMDPAEIPAAMASEEGERVIMAVVDRNMPRIKTRMGIRN